MRHYFLLETLWELKFRSFNHDFEKIFIHSTKFYQLFSTVCHYISTVGKAENLSANLQTTGSMSETGIRSVGEGSRTTKLDDRHRTKQHFKASWLGGCGHLNLLSGLRRYDGVCGRYGESAIYSRGIERFAFCQNLVHLLAGPIFFIVVTILVFYKIWL